MQLKFHMVTIEDLVPEGHFLRKLDTVLDLGFVYEEMAHLYSRRYGRPPIDPVVLVKYLLVGFLYGIPSERQIEQRIQTDVALRWYLGLDLFADFQRPLCQQLQSVPKLWPHSRKSSRTAGNCQG